MSAKQVYQITGKAGPSIAGRRRVPGSTTIELTPEEAEFELSAGTIVPSGQALPPVVVPAPILPTDIVTVIRNGAPREVTADQLRAFLGLPTTPPVSGTASSDLDLSNPLSPGVSTIL